MKQVLRLFSVLLIALLYSGQAPASLLQYNSQVVLDDRGTASESDDLFFFRDLSRFSDMTYAEQLTSVGLLNSELAGLGPWAANWHLANPDEMTNLFDDFVTVPDVFLPSYGTGYVGRYEEIPGPDGHLAYEVYVGGSPPVTHELYEVLDSSAYPLLGAWAVANYRAPVPEAATVYLLLIGLLSLLLIRRLSPVVLKTR